MSILEKPEKISKRNILALFFISFGGNIAWAIENQYYNVYLFNALGATQFQVGLMVAVTAVVSTFTTIIMGSLQDIRGKRRSFIITAFILWAIVSATFPLSGFITPTILSVAVAIGIDCVMSFFGATAYDAGYNGFLIDITTVKNRAKAVSINEIMTLFGTLVVYGISGFLLDPEVVGMSYLEYFIYMAIATGVLGLIGAFAMKDSPTLKPLDTTFWKHIKSTFNRDAIRKNKDCFKVLGAIAIQATSFSIFFPFVVLYLQHTQQLGVMESSIVMFAGLFISVLLSLPIGIFIDKIGRKRIAIASIVLECGALVLFSFAEGFLWLTITGVIWVFFMMVWHIASQSWAGDLYPPEKAGQFNGYFLIVNVLIPMVIGSPIGGLIGDAFGPYVLVEGEITHAPPALLFLIGAVVVIFAIIPLISAKEKQESIPEPPVVHEPVI